MRSALADVRFGSKADMCGAPSHVRFTPNSDRESGLPQTVISALPPKADIDLHRAHLKRIPPMEGRDRRARACAGGTRHGEIPTQQRTRLLVFARAGSDAVVRGLRVHDRIGVILHCARDLLDTIKLIGAGWVHVRWNCFSHCLEPSCCFVSQY